MPSETLPAYVDRLARRERAARHAVSTPLLLHTLALAVVLTLDALLLVRLAEMTATEWSGGSWEAVARNPAALLPLLPLVVYLALWVASRFRTRLTGVGPGHDGWGVMALVSAALLAALPVSLMAMLVLGPVFFLGVGLGVLGGRLREPSLWGPGLVLIAVGPFVNLRTFDDHAGLVGPWPTRAVLTVLLLGLAATTVAALRRERRTLADAPAAAP